MELKCPPLGTGSVDVSALHKAAKSSNPDMAKAVEAAKTIVAAKPEPKAKTTTPKPTASAADAD